MYGLNLLQTLKEKMKTLNFIDMIKMPKKMVDFKRFLKLLLPENQLYEIKYMIKEFNKSNHKGGNRNKKFCILN